MTTVRFREWECKVERLKYSNGRTALVLIDARNQEEVAVATINLPDQPLEPGQVFIKDYSENAGMLAALEQAGIVKATGETIQAGIAQIPKASLLSPEQERSGHQHKVDEVAKRPPPAKTNERER